MGGWLWFLLFFSGDSGGEAFGLFGCRGFCCVFFLEVEKKRRTDWLGIPHGIQLHIKRGRALYSLLQFS